MMADCLDLDPEDAVQMDTHPETDDFPEDVIHFVGEDLEDVDLQN